MRARESAREHESTEYRYFCVPDTGTGCLVSYCTVYKTVYHVYHGITDYGSIIYGTEIKI